MIKNTFSHEELNKLVGILFECEQALVSNNWMTRFIAVHKLAAVTDALNALVPNEHQRWAR